ncbi:hypothetical protein KQX54_020989 [Cotesia glomerata]|uniref:Uncharacterized protein n=1 Tax=Cotesia glomerata TaxID=32391 RepID=A0AAV7J988_COTGL|nr:hypothetical protein KQX54_020989 [Cotesia glomerata]
MDVYVEPRVWGMRKARNFLLIGPRDPPILFQVSAANQVLLREGFSRDKGEEGPGSRRTLLRRKRNTWDVGRGLLGNVRPTNKGHFEGR